VFHIAQAFVRDDGALVVDAIRYGRYPNFDRLQDLFSGDDPALMPHLERLVIDPESAHCDITIWSPRGAELPVTAAGALGEPHRFIYSIGAPAERAAPYLSSLQRLDTETGELRCRDFGLDIVGEPIFVPDPNASAATSGNEGWLLSLVYRAGRQRSELLVLRAADLETVATVTLPHRVPLGFHGCWVPRADLHRG